MPPKLIIFTGAPDAAIISWDETNLMTEFQSRILRFCGRDTESSQEACSSLNPSWRLLSNHKNYLTNSAFTINYPNNLLRNNVQDIIQTASFFKTPKTKSSNLELSLSSPTPDLDISQAAEQELSQFYEESYIKHEDTFLLLPTYASTLISIASSFTSNDGCDTNDLSFSSDIVEIKDITIFDRLTDLKDIPSAAYLESIYPQTITCDVIVAIISIADARIIKTRRGDMNLIEVLVADETKSGFTINFWLPLLSSRGASEYMKSILCKSQQENILLVQNMALASFRGKVYGQSLRKDLTKVHILGINQNFRFRIANYNNYAQSQKNMDILNLHNAKMNKVVEWLITFVRIDAVMSRDKNHIHKFVAEQLPPDTQ